MTETTATLRQESAFDLRRVPGWFWFAGWVYVVLLTNGSVLLRDSDTYWQIAVGRWILDHGALPHADVYSFTKFGEAWISSSWLAQVLYAGAYGIAGWAGVVSLAAIGASITFAQFISILSRRIPAVYANAIAFVAFFLSVTHFFARPHLLALPVMLAWTNGLLSASERREAPSFWLLPLIALWANLHGGFVFGLVLVGAFALDTVWNESGPADWRLALRWLGFGICGCLACCVTPYGWETIPAAYRILDLGELLHVIPEWKPTDFGSVNGFEVTILGLIAGALYWGIRLRLPRIALALGLLHMALSHVRNQEILLLLLPLVLLAPVTAQLGIEVRRPARRMTGPIAAAAVLTAVFGVGTLLSAADASIQPPAFQTPTAAVDILAARNAKRVFHDAQFGGYLIWRDIPVFLDGRAELYGEKFVMDYYHALFLEDVNVLLRILKDDQIDAVLLRPDTPASLLLDHLDGWKRVYADQDAVVHVRAGN
jgi:hypothetical protein